MVINISSEVILEIMVKQQVLLEQEEEQDL